MTPQALFQLRSALPKCELAVFADIQAGTVLASDGALDYPQEYLNTVGDCAAIVFGVPMHDEPPFDEAMFETPAAKHVFLRDQRNLGEVLCIICAPDAEVAQVRDIARDALSSIQSPRIGVA